MNKKLLVVVPYRNREDNLKQFIPHIKYKLQQQNIDNTIVIVEQYDNKLFNRGLLCNVGYSEFNKISDYVCFHDVDMLCETDYSYSNIPLSLLRKRTKTDNIFDKYFGGVILFPKCIFEQINGFSNEYKGWGAEDDDLRLRCTMNNICVSYRDGFCQDLELIPENINRYNNPNYKNNLNKLTAIQNNKTYNTTTDGLSTINLCVKILDIIQTPTYKKIQCQTI